MERYLVEGVEGLAINAGVWDPPIALGAVPSLTALPEVSLPQTTQPIPSASPGSAITSSPLPIESNAVKSSSKSQDLNVNHPAKTSSGPQPNISNGVRESAPGSAIAWIISQLLRQTPQQTENSDGVALNETPETRSTLNGKYEGHGLSWMMNQLLELIPSKYEGHGLSWTMNQLLELIPSKYEGHGLSWTMNQLLELIPSNLVLSFLGKPSPGAAFDNDFQHQEIGILPDIGRTDLDTSGNRNLGATGRALYKSAKANPSPTATITQVSGNESLDQSSQTTGFLSGENAENTHSTADGRISKPLEDGRKLKNESKVTLDMPWRMLLLSFGVFFFF
jgi:hypothetical protein